RGATSQYAPLAFRTPFQAELGFNAGPIPGRASHLDVSSLDAEIPCRHARVIAGEHGLGPDGAIYRTGYRLSCGRVVGRTADAARLAGAQSEIIRDVDCRGHDDCVGARGQFSQSPLVRRM